MSFRRFVSVILSYAIAISGCGPKNRSSHLSNVSEPETTSGPLKTEAEISGAIKALSLHTERWLTCKDPSLGSECVELDFSDKNMTSVERKRLKLKNLLIAKKRASYERNGVQMGIWIDEIEKDLKALQEELKDAINELNLNFFKQIIGQDPFTIQKSFFLSQEFFSYLSERNSDQRREEIEKQFMVLKMINPGFYDNQELVKELMLEYIYSVGLLEIDWRNIDEQQSQIISRYFLGLIENYQGQVDLVLSKLVKPYDVKDRDVLVSSAEIIKQLNDQEKRLFKIWSDLSKTNADALSETFIDLMASISYSDSSQLSSEDFFNDQIKLALQSKLKTKNTDSIFIAGQVKFAMSAFMSFDMFGLLRIVYIGIGFAQFFKSILIDYYDPTIFLGIGSGLIWTFKAIYNLTELYGGIDLLKAKMLEIWPKIKTSSLGVSLDLFKNFSRNYLLAGNTTLINFFEKIGSILYRVSTILNIALLVSLVYNLINLSNSFKDLNTVQKVLSIIGTSIVVTWLTVGITSVFLTIPGANVFWIVSTIVCFFVYLFVSLFQSPPKDVRPNENDPDVLFYKNQIDPDKSYWAWCEEDGKSINCQQNFQPGILIGKSKSYEPLIMTREIGGPRGKKQLIFHYLDAKASQFNALDMLGFIRIKKIELLNCKDGNRDHRIGLSYEVESRFIAPEDRLFEMGCTEERDVIYRESMQIDSDDALATVKIYHSLKNLPSRRIVGLKVCTKNGHCIETRKMPDIYYDRWVSYSNDLSYREQENSYTAVGEVIGFHGRYGDTIDSLGVYYKAPAPEYYKREFVDDLLPWYHLAIPNGFCYQAGGAGHLVEHQQNWENKFNDLSINEGRCPCSKFVHTFYERGWQGVCKPSTI